jgi:rubrerythrin
MLSRRTFLRATGVTGGAALLAGCGTADEVLVEPRDPEDDVELLNDLLEIELAAASFYERAAEQLDGEAAEFAELFARQEREHADALTEAIEARDATPSEPDDEPDLPEDQDELLQAAADIENEAIFAMNDAVARLSDPELRRTVFTIVAVESEHLTVIRGELGEPQAPDSFAIGTPA